MTGTKAGWAQATVHLPVHCPETAPTETTSIAAAQFRFPSMNARFSDHNMCVLSFALCPSANGRFVCVTKIHRAEIKCNKDAGLEGTKGNKSKTSDETLWVKCSQNRHLILGSECSK